MGSYKKASTLPCYKAFKDDLDREYLERPFRCFNPLLDTFPTSYKGVPVKTDFRVGIELFRLFNNVKLSDLEKKERALILFYKDNIPEDVNFAWSGIEWFMHLGYNKSRNEVAPLQEEKQDGDVTKKGIEESSCNSDSCLDFDFDASRIYTAFLVTYGIDLQTVQYLHFFKFMFMLSDVSNECQYNKVLEIRKTSLAGKKGRERAVYMQMKRMFAIPFEVSDEDKKALEDMGISSDDLDQFMQM